MSTNVAISNEKELLEAIQRVRADTDPTNWVIVGHKDDDPNTIKLNCTGSDGFEGLASQLDDSKALYCLLRVTTTVDLSVTVKFVYIRWLGTKVPFVKKGKYSVVHGAIIKSFQPYHVDFDVESLREISPELIKQKVEKAAGNANYVRATSKENLLEKNSASSTNLCKPGSQPNLVSKEDKLHTDKPVVPDAVKQSQGALVDSNLKSAIKDLRDNRSSLTWVAGRFPNCDIQKPLEYLASGSGNSSEFKKHLEPSQLVYILYKVNDVIDGHNTIKFAHVNWIGNEVSSTKS
jgi:hypothetical protein